MTLTSYVCSVFATFIYFSTFGEGHYCYYCASAIIGESFSSSVFQQRLFAYPRDAAQSHCGLPGLLETGRAQICERPLCAAIVPRRSPGMADNNFTVLGCAETILRPSMLPRIPPEVHIRQNSGSLCLDFDHSVGGNLKFTVCFCTDNWCNTGEDAAWWAGHVADFGRARVEPVAAPLYARGTFLTSTMPNKSISKPGIDRRKGVEDNALFESKLKSDSATTSAFSTRRPAFATAPTKSSLPRSPSGNWKKDSFKKPISVVFAINFSSYKQPPAAKMPLKHRLVSKPEHGIRSYSSTISSVSATRITKFYSQPASYDDASVSITRAPTTPEPWSPNSIIFSSSKASQLPEKINFASTTLPVTKIFQTTAAATTVKAVGQSISIPSKTLSTPTTKTPQISSKPRMPTAPTFSKKSSKTPSQSVSASEEPNKAQEPKPKNESTRFGNNSTVVDNSSGIGLNQSALREGPDQKLTPLRGASSWSDPRFLSECGRSASTSGSSANSFLSLGVYLICVHCFYLLCASQFHFC